eukprot:1968939-Prymnesium_polylepis.1
MPPHPGSAASATWKIEAACGTGGIFDAADRWWQLSTLSAPAPTAMPRPTSSPAEANAEGS